MKILKKYKVAVSHIRNTKLNLGQCSKKYERQDKREISWNKAPSSNDNSHHFNAFTSTFERLFDRPAYEKTAYYYFNDTLFEHFKDKPNEKIKVTAFYKDGVCHRNPIKGPALKEEHSNMFYYVDSSPYKYTEIKKETTSYWIEGVKTQANTTIVDGDVVSYTTINYLKNDEIEEPEDIVFESGCFDKG